jgi:hypothetical protein
MGRPGYPKNMREFRQRFSTPEACRAYLVQCRWPDAFVCPTCSGKKAWLNGTHHGVEPKHLPSDLDEFVFRFNRRKTPMAAFQTLLGISAQKSPISLTELMSPESK